MHVDKNGCPQADFEFKWWKSFAGIGVLCTLIAAYCFLDYYVLDPLGW